MADTKATEELKRAYERLPAVVQEAIFSDDTENLVLATGRKFGLHIDEVGILEHLVKQILLGLLPPEKFAEELTFLSGVDKEKAVAVTKDLNASLFTPLHNKILKAGAGETKEEILAAIENPEATKSRIVNEEREVVKDEKEVVKDEERTVVGREVTPPVPQEPAVAVPVTANVDVPKIHEQKLQDIVRIAPKTTEVQMAPSQTAIIPEDHKVDPYREAV